MPEKPDRDASGRRRLSPAVVVDRAMALADAEGLQAVTVRRLAELLGVTPMALYWHFHDKSSLLNALADRILAEADLTIDDPDGPDDPNSPDGPNSPDHPDAPWPAQLRRVTASLLRALRAHPWATPLFHGDDPGEPSLTRLRALEVFLTILARGGLPPVRAVGVTRHILRTVVGMVADEPHHRPPAAPETRSRMLAEWLPAEQFPHVLAAAGPLTTCDDPDDYYAFGLELLLAGIRTVTAGTDTPQQR